MLGCSASCPFWCRQRSEPSPRRVGGSRPVSYRSFKHLLGETSLERKCRFIFGLGILLLVSASFFWYGQKTESLVMKQTTQTARMLVNPTLKDIHYKALGNSNFESILEVLWGDLKPLEDLPTYKARILNPYNLKDSSKQPADAVEKDALDRFIKGPQAEDPARKLAGPKDKLPPIPMWDHRITNGKKEYQYIQS